MRSTIYAVLAVTLLACGAPGPEPASGDAATSTPAAAAGDTPVTAEGPSLDAWERVLGTYAVDGGVDYAALAAQRGDLDSFVAALASARPAELDREGRIAFWINAYNALVLSAVLEHYPGIESVIKVEGFFDAETHSVAGEELTLNQVERRGLDEGDPRVHFAVVCASTGCPDLRPEAYRREALEEQLAQQTAAYLADPSKGLRYDQTENVLFLSSIFDWYAADFGGDAIAWLVPRLPEALASVVQEKKPPVRFLDYDWSLNDRSRDDGHRPAR